MVKINSKWAVGSRKWLIKRQKWLGMLMLTTSYFLLPTPSLYGYSLLGLDNCGDPVTGFSARSIGMGSTDITAANDSAALSSNPAALLNMTARKLVISVSPVYNVFEEKKNVDGVYSEYTIINIDGLGASAPLYFGGSDYFNKFIAGIHMHPVTDFSYKYSNKAYTDVTELDMAANLNSSGGINEIDMGFGLEIIKEIYLGFSYGILSGENPVEFSRADYANSAVHTSTTSDTTSKFEGNCLRYGLILTKWDYSLGAFYQPSSSIKVKTTGIKSDYNITMSNVWKSADVNSEVEAKMPEKFGVGFSYRFKDKYRTLFAVDYVQQNWNAFTSATTFNNGVATGNRKQHTPGYESTKEIKVGFQHWLNDWIPVRYGFRSQQFYQTWDNEILNFYLDSDILKMERPTFYCISFGSGYVFNYFDIDFGYEFGKRSYETASSERFDEYLQKFALTARYRW